MTHNSPEKDQPSTEHGLKTPSEQGKNIMAIDTRALATSILMKCGSGEDVRSDFEQLAQHAVEMDMIDYVATALAQHIDLLTQPHHWMTLAKGAGQKAYVQILEHARWKVGQGTNQLIIGTKLADTLRRIGDEESLAKAEKILGGDIKSTMNVVPEFPEMSRALGSALYTRSFIPLGKKPRFGTGEELHAVSQSLDDLRKSAEYSREGGDEEGAVQSEIRACGVQLDQNYGDAMEILATLEALVAKLQGAASTWGKRFLYNALGRRVEAAAKSRDPRWGAYFAEYIALPGIEQHCGGAEAFDEWKAEHNPFTPEATEQPASEE